MKNTSILLLISLLSCQAPKETQQKTIRIPAEFEPQEAIWLGFKTLDTYGDTEADSITLEMIRAIHPYVDLKLIIENDTLVGDVFSDLHAEGIDTSRIELVFQANTDVWYRDPGPVFCITPENELGIIDFEYTNYNNISHDSISERARLFEALDRDIAERMGIPTIKSKIAIEGGALETNGKGTLIQVEAVTLGRNPHLSKEEIEDEYARCCGISKVIWLPRGVADDPLNRSHIVDNIFGVGTGGHTDEFVRFANDSTILLSWIDEEERAKNPINEMNYEILTEHYRILSEAVDAKGKKFNIVKIPHPDPYHYSLVVEDDWYQDDWWREQSEQTGLQTGDFVFWSYSCSYLNHLTTNSILLIPEYRDGLKRKNKKDSIAKSIFKSLYPDRKVVGINPLVFNGGGGGMHCRFQTQPKIIN